MKTILGIFAAVALAIITLFLINLVASISINFVVIAFKLVLFVGFVYAVSRIAKWIGLLK